MTDIDGVKAQVAMLMDWKKTQEAQDIEQGKDIVMLKGNVDQTKIDIASIREILRRQNRAFWGVIIVFLGAAVRMFWG